jgi:GNAT superfamily N-acetyltransferase
LCPSALAKRNVGPPPVAVANRQAKWQHQAQIVLRIRPYSDGDERGVLHLLGEAFGTWPHGLPQATPTEVFRWKHLENPFGRSVMLIAEADGAPIGFAAWLRWRMRAGERTYEALRAVDVAVHPAFQRRGVFAALLGEATRQFPPEAAFTLSSPNRLSRPGALGLGGRKVGVVPLFILVPTPMRSAIRWLGAGQPGAAAVDCEPVGQAESARSALQHGADVAALLSQLRPPTARLYTVPDLEYLRWRYGDVGGYHAVRELHDGRLTGLAVFRVRGRNSARVTNVCELLVREGDHRSARRLLRRVASATAVDFVVCHFPAGSTARRAAVRSGFIRAPFGLLPTVRRLKDGVVPDPVAQEAWALSLGDFDQL